MDIYEEIQTRARKCKTVADMVRLCREIEHRPLEDHMITGRNIATLISDAVTGEDSRGGLYLVSRYGPTIWTSFFCEDLSIEETMILKQPLPPLPYTID